MPTIRPTMAPDKSNPWGEQNEAKVSVKADAQKSKLRQIQGKSQRELIKMQRIKDNWHFKLYFKFDLKKKILLFISDIDKITPIHYEIIPQASSQKKSIY